MAVLYLSLHLAVFTGSLVLISSCGGWSEVEYGIVSGKIVRPFLCEVSYLMWWAGDTGKRGITEERNNF